MNILTEEQQRILDLAKKMLDDIESYSLDTIDGTFYWRGCHGKVVDALRAKVAVSAREAVADDSGDYIRARMMLEGQIPGIRGIGFDWDRIPMRGAVIMPPVIESGPTARKEAAELKLVAKIRNAEWNGTDVAGAIHAVWERWLQEFSSDSWKPLMDFRMQAAQGINHLSIDVDLVDDKIRVLDMSELNLASFKSLFRPGEEQIQFRYLPSPQFEYEPAVVMKLSMPLIAPEVIATYYDHVVRNHYQWHKRLRGAKNGQDRITAVRTWMVALLTKSGMRYVDAIREVEEVGTDAASSTKHGTDKKRLLNRVPEATPFV